MAQLILTDEEKKANRYSDLSDEALGKVIRKLIFGLDSTAKELERLPDIAAATLLCCSAARQDAESLAIEMCGIIEGGRDLGDFRIVVTKISNAGNSPKK